MINFKQRDKQLHFLGGFCLSFAFSFVSPLVGFLVAIFAGWAKELYDQRHPESHTKDDADMLATWLGGVIGIILFFILSILERFT